MLLLATLRYAIEGAFILSLLVLRGINYSGVPTKHAGPNNFVGGRFSQILIKV